MSVPSISGAHSRFGSHYYKPGRERERIFRLNQLPSLPKHAHVRGRGQFRIAVARQSSVPARMQAGLEGMPHLSRLEVRCHLDQQAGVAIIAELHLEVGIIPIGGVILQVDSLPRVGPLLGEPFALHITLTLPRDRKQPIAALPQEDVDEVRTLSRLRIVG